MAKRKQTTDHLEQQLADFRQQLQNAGSLNGTTESARRVLEQMQADGRDLSDWQDLIDAVGGLGAEDFEPWEIDVDMAEAHLAAVGIGPDDPVILCAYGSTNMFVPDRFDFYPAEVKQEFSRLKRDRKKAEDSGTPADVGRAEAALKAFNESQYVYDWEKVSAEHAKRVAQGLSRDWDRIRQLLKSHRTPNLGYIGGIGGTSIKKRQEIFAMQTLAQEVDQYVKRDDKGKAVPVPPEVQMAAPGKAGLPEPTVRMDTGGKSIHQYWVLTEPCTVPEGQEARKRLFHTINTACPDLSCDGSIHTGMQPLRLAGGVHPKTRRRSRLLTGSGELFVLSDLLEHCLELPTAEQGAPGEAINDRYDDEPHPGETFPDLPVSDRVPFPLARALSRKTQNVILNGQREGVGNGRFVKAHSLSRSLQAACAQLVRLGQHFAGSAEGLFEQYVIASEMYGGDFEEAYDKHWEKDGDAIGEPELSDLALRRVIRRWAEEEGLWKSERSGWEARIAFARRRNQTWIEVAVWRVNSLKTAERVVEEALKVKAEMEEAPLTCFQERFLRYDPVAGFYRHLTSKTLKREIALVLPQVHSLRIKPKCPGFEEQTHKAATEAKATACVKWLNTVLHEERMDVVPAVAFTNGTYLIDHLKLVEHSPDFRLTWAINGAYVPEAECPTEFKRFVCESFGEEWLDVIRMTLRYLIDPSFKPQKIVTILGSSGSGKGTLERLIEKLFPLSCISVITSGFADINHPDKIRQFVRGKRLVAFPDLQGRQFGVGTLYSMTDGGLLTSRTLHESEADEGEAFTGRVVICSTQPPVMEDAGNGMTRRMLVLRTRRPDSDRHVDVDLDDKLEAELGLIVSWALQADPEAVKKMLNVGDEGGLLSSAATTAEVSMDSIRGFIDACLSPAPGGSKAITDPDQIYQAFELYRHDRNHKAMNRNTFVARVTQALPHLKQERKSVPGTNSKHKVKACFYGLQLNEGLIKRATLMVDEKSLPHRVMVRDMQVVLDRRSYGEGGLEELRGLKDLESPDLAHAFKIQQGLK